MVYLAVYCNRIILLSKSWGDDDDLYFYEWRDGL